MKEESVLTVGELLERAYQDLKSKNDGIVLEFPEKVRAEIANDSDWHKRRIGYMGYQRALVLEFNDVYAVCYGVSGNKYPAVLYSGDITAVKIDPPGKTTTEKIKETIRSSRYFRNSLLFGRADGRLVVSRESPFGEEMANRLGPKLDDFVTQSLKKDGEFYTLAVKYKPEFVEFISDSIREILADR